jgi:hypothetical protein
MTKIIKNPKISEISRENKITLAVIKDVIKHLNNIQTKEFLKGAHIQFIDNHYYYNKWTKKYPGYLKKSYSSHKSTRKQYRVRSAKIPEILIGTKRKGTWIQLERTPVTKPVGHFIDYIAYTITGDNQGPYGSSKYTEKNPIIIKLSKRSRSTKRYSQKIKSTRIKSTRIKKCKTN